MIQIFSLDVSGLSSLDSIVNESTKFAWSLAVKFYEVNPEKDE